MLRRRLWLAGAAAMAFLNAVAPSAAPVSAAPPAAAAAPGPPRIHAPGEQLERAVGDVVVSFLRDNAPAAVEGLNRLESACRKLSRTETPAVPRDVLLYDQAFHTALERSRELAAGNHVTSGFDQFVWVMRACRQCHEVSRRAGLDSRRPFGEPAAGAKGQP